MKATIKFRNEKGQFTSTNANFGFEYETNFCSIKVSRVGQQDPAYSNQVEVRAEIVSNGKRIKFNKYLFGYLLNSSIWNNERVLSSPSFFNNTWREAFADAKRYVEEQLKIYEELVNARNQALIDAEF
jgi:hypothetical protein